MSAIEALPQVEYEDPGLHELIEDGTVLADDPAVEGSTRVWQHGSGSSTRVLREEHFISYRITNDEGEDVRREQLVDEVTQRRVLNQYGLGAVTRWVVDSSTLY